MLTLKGILLNDCLTFVAEKTGGILDDEDHSTSMTAELRDASVEFIRVETQWRAHGEHHRLMEEILANEEKCA